MYRPTPARLCSNSTLTCKAAIGNGKKKPTKVIFLLPFPYSLCLFLAEKLILEWIVLPN